MIPRLFGCVLLLVHSANVFAFQVTINQSGTVANSCTRTLTAVVSGGSGSYAYTWSVVTPTMAWPGPNGVSTVYLSLDQTADVNVSVKDLSNNQIVQNTVTVYRVLLGSFNIFRPNLITPNGDGYNDNWIVTDASKNYSPINAYSYTISIKNSSNVQVFQDSDLVTTGHLGVIGGDILWDARVGGSVVPVGVYDYVLVLENCSGSTQYNGQISVMY